MAKSVLAAMKEKYKSLNRDQAVPESTPKSKSTAFLDSISAITADFVRSDLVETEFGLGLLFIIIDDLPHELVWRRWLELSSSENQKKVHIWIHAKFPDRVTSAWTRTHLVEFCFRPEWGSVEITKAMVELMRKAVDSNLPVSTLCFVSESCLPATTLDNAIARLADDSTSWVNWISKPNNGYAAQLQFTPLQGWLPPSSVLKADQWVQLARRHAIDILHLIDATRRQGFDLFEPFRKVRASDEIFIPTCLALTGHLSKSNMAPYTGTVTATPELVVSEGVAHTARDFQRRRVTYCSWTDANARSPYTFYDLRSGADTDQPGVAEGAARDGCLFMRKIAVSKEGSAVEGLNIPSSWTGRVRILQEWEEKVTAKGRSMDYCDQDLLGWAGDVINTLMTSLPVGLSKSSGSWRDSGASDLRQGYNRRGDYERGFADCSHRREVRGRDDQNIETRERYSGCGHQDRTYRDESRRGRPMVTSHYNRHDRERYYDSTADRHRRERSRSRERHLYR